MDAGVHGREAGHLARAGVVAGHGGDLAAGDGNVQGNDVLGVDQPGGAGPADHLAGVIPQPTRARGAGGDDGQHPAWPQHPLARRVQHAGAGSRLAGFGVAAPGDDQGRLPDFRVAGLQEQRRAAGPDLGELAQLRVHVAEARQDPLARAGSRGQAQDTTASRGSRRDEHAVADIGDGDQLTWPGERGDDLRGVRAAGLAPTPAAQRPGARAGCAPRDRRPDADRHAEPRAADGCDRLLFSGTGKAGLGGRGQRTRVNGWV